MKRAFLFISFCTSVIIFFSFSASTSYYQQPKEQPEKIIEIQENIDYPAPGKACLSCHDGLEAFTNHNSQMAQQIYRLGKKDGDPNGCIVCHQGNPKEESNMSIAHKDLIKFPGSMWVLDKTCNKCHKKYGYKSHRSLMQTEAGKIQGALWGWGASTGYKAQYGNYDIDDSDGPVPYTGTQAYKDYMKKLIDKYPDNFPGSLEELPKADISSINDHPEQGVLTYLRSECQRCHTGVKGVQRRGDYHGMGCSACHIPYSTEGFYEGNDKSINKDERGHILTHSLQATRKSKVTINDITYSGIPAETCTSCHNRGKRAGVSFLGLMESPYNTPFGEDGKGQDKLHGKYYQFIQSDHHHTVESREENPKGGLTCQDCHTTISVHGDGNIFGTTLAQVEIECADCHGTPDSYPWELPLGFGDEFEIKANADPRGTAEELLEETRRFATVYENEDGYLLSSRGNPLGNVVRREDKVILHSAGGLDFYVPTLKALDIGNAWKNPIKATTAMKNVSAHLNKMECYSCHSAWAAQCYGCHIKIDYSNNLTSTDWIETGKSHNELGETIETISASKLKKLSGKVSEGRTYLRWENPILGVNGEGRVSPIIPGCQQITTVIDPDGKTLVDDKIWRTPPNMENGGSMGQRGIDMSPAQPHTVTAKARECTSCHTDPKALGYGIADGSLMNSYSSNQYTDLTTQNGEIISNKSIPQLSSIDDLPYDLSQVVTRDNKQIQTVGHHWPLSGPLSKDQRDRMERIGVCIACHQDIPGGNMFISLISKAGQITGLTPYSDEDHAKLLNRDLNILSLIYVGSPIFIGLIIVLLLIYRRRKKKLAQN